jgi:hypothetical protein
MFGLSTLFIVAGCAVFAFGVYAEFRNGIARFAGLTGCAALMLGFVLFAYEDYNKTPHTPIPNNDTDTDTDSDTDTDTIPDDKPTPKPPDTPDDNNKPVNPDVPKPTPLPLPTVTPFGENVGQTFVREGGSPNDAIVLSALFEQMSKILIYDGQRPNPPGPQITTGEILGSIYREMQRYQASSESPWGTRYAGMQQLVTSELATRVQALSASVVIDANKRIAAAAVFQEASDGLKKVYIQAHNALKQLEYNIQTQ